MLLTCAGARAESIACADALADSIALLGVECISTVVVDFWLVLFLGFDVFDVFRDVFLMVSVDASDPDSEHDRVWLRRFVLCTGSGFANCSVRFGFAADDVVVVDVAGMFELDVIAE